MLLLVPLDKVFASGIVRVYSVPLYYCCGMLAGFVKYCLMAPIFVDDAGGQHQPEGRAAGSR